MEQNYHSRPVYMYSDLRRAKISLRNIVSQFTNTISDDFMILQMNCT